MHMVWPMQGLPNLKARFLGRSRSTLMVSWKTCLRAVVLGNMDPSRRGTECPRREQSSLLHSLARGWRPGCWETGLPCFLGGFGSALLTATQTHPAFCSYVGHKVPFGALPPGLLKEGRSQQEGDAVLLIVPPNKPGMSRAMSQGDCGARERGQGWQDRRGAGAEHHPPWQQKERRCTFSPFFRLPLLFTVAG